MWKVILGAVLLITAYAAGWYSSTRTVEVEKIVTRDRVTVQEKIVTKTIIRRPDGTVEETIKEEDRETDTRRKDTELSTKRGDDRSGYGSYRVSLNYWVGNAEDAVQFGRQLNRYGIGASKRIIGPFWLEAQIRPSPKEVALGLGVEW